MAFIDRYFERQGLKSDEVTVLHKLAFIGDRGMGAIEYRPKEHEDRKDKAIKVVAGVGSGALALGGVAFKYGKKAFTVVRKIGSV